MKGMAVRKENRYQSVKEFRDALERAVNGAPVASLPQMPPAYAAAQSPYNTRQGYPSQPQHNTQQGYPSVQQGYPAPPPYKAQQPFSQQLHYSSSWTPNNTPVNSPRPDGNGAPQPNYRQPPQADEAGKKPTVSLVFGILSLVFLILFGCIGGSDLLGIGGGLGFGIAAISVGISAKNKGSYSGKITAGIITGAAGISLTLFIVLLAIGYLYSYHRFKKVRIKRN